MPPPSTSSSHNPTSSPAKAAIIGVLRMAGIRGSTAVGGDGR
jgi:hypothetical protein